MSLPATEGFDPRLESLAEWPVRSAVAALWEGQLAAVAAIGPALPSIASAIEAATARLREHPAGRLAYAGAGSSARIAAQDGAELLPTFDWPAERLLLLPAGGVAALSAAVENAEDDREAASTAVAAARLGPGDVLIGVAASGATPFTVAALEGAVAAGALGIGVASTGESPLLEAATHPVLVQTGAEPIAGSTRMKAGTAQKVVLNLISTGIMLGLGRVHRGRMVAMRPTNAKLRARAVRMVASLSGRETRDAAALLEQAEGSIAHALLIGRGCTLAEARACLAHAGGDLGSALETLGTGR